jgi:hypothetical protein
MVAIVIVQKNGEYTSHDVRDASSKNLYKRVGLRVPGSFAKRVSWKVGCDGNSIYVSIYAKDTGNAGHENKTELPPPIDKDLYFGKIVIVSSKDEDGREPVDLPLDIWKGVRDQLFGGFEDLGEGDSSESEDDIAPEMMTKHGYEKDGFVVDESDDPECSDLGDSDLSEDEYEGESDYSEDEFTSNS